MPKYTMLFNLVSFSVLLFCVTGDNDVINIYTGGESCANNTDFVAFSVASQVDFAPASNARVPFEVVFYNRGGHYDTSTNVFTVPVTGLYSVYFSAAGENKKLTYIVLYVGNSPVAQAYDYSNRGHGNAGARVLLELKKGDGVSVWMHQYGSGLYALDGDTRPSRFFNAYLLHKL